MARIDTLPNFLTDVATAIRNKTGESELLAPENYDTEIESISGGGYDGQLPNNSSIARILCVGSELRVYLNVDALASGTRVYYKENDLPTLTDSYIDVPRNSSYGIIPNVNLNSMYGVRVAAYVIYDSNKKAFNNSMSIGCTAFKLTTQYNAAGAVLLDLPLEVQGSSVTFTTYSKYTNTFYMGIASKLYKVDCTSATPQFERIGADQTFSSNMRMTPTDQGVFIQGSSYWLLYDETAETFTSTGLTTSGYVEVLSNDDIFGNDGQYGGGTLKKFNKTNKTWENFNGNYRGSDSWYVDTGTNIYITTKYSGSTGFKVYKYNGDTGDYDFIGQNTSAGNSRGIWGLKELIGTIVVMYNYNLYYLSGTTFKQANVQTYEYGYNYFGRDDYNRYNNIIQDPNNINNIYIFNYSGYYSYSKKIYKLDINTDVVEELYSFNSSNSDQMWGIYFNGKIITTVGYYDINTSTWTTKTLGDLTTSYIIKNNKLYRINANVGVLDESTMTFTNIGAVAGGSYPYIHFIENNDKLYLYDYTANTTSPCGIKVLDTTTDTITQISNGLYKRAVVLNNKIYFRGDNNIKQFVVNLNDDTYYESSYNSATGVDVGYSIEGGNSALAGRPNSTTNTIYNYDEQYLETMYDSTNKVLYGLDKQLLDLGSSTKTYTLRDTYWYMYNYIYSGACYQSNDYSELVILFTQQNNS